MCHAVEERKSRRSAGSVVKGEVHGNLERIRGGAREKMVREEDLGI